MCQNWRMNAKKPSEFLLDSIRQPPMLYVQPYVQLRLVFSQADA